jgi:hypothetical protein
MPSTPGIERSVISKSGRLLAVHQRLDSVAEGMKVQSTGAGPILSRWQRYSSRAFCRLQRSAPADGFGIDVGLASGGL